jgi:hypothetical protein
VDTRGCELYNFSGQLCNTYGYKPVSFTAYPPDMQSPSKKKIDCLHRQIITNENQYRQALKLDQQFSVLKGFKDILKQLREKLEQLPAAKS